MIQTAAFDGGVSSSRISTESFGVVVTGVEEWVAHLTHAFDLGSHTERQDTAKTHIGPQSEYPNVLENLFHTVLV